MTHIWPSVVRGQLKYDDTRAETRFRLSAKRTSPLNWRGRQFRQLLAAEVCASAVVMLDKQCSEVVWRVLATLSIRLFPLHFPSRASPCAIIFQLESTTQTNKNTPGCSQLMSLLRPKPEHHSNKSSDTVNLTTQLMSYEYEALPKKSGEFKQRAQTGCRTPFHR